MRNRKLLLILFAFLVSHCAAGQKNALHSQENFRVMSWNIWHGGRADGADVGPPRVVDVIRDSRADIIALQETYGSGEWIAEQLGFHFHPRGTNVSLLSRYPIIEDISVFQEFKCVGALLALPNQRHIACYSIWLPYAKEIWEPATRNLDDLTGLLAACQPSADDLTAIWSAIQTRLADDKYRGVPIVIAGDFNSMSHLDYGEIGLDQYKAVIEWTTSPILLKAGFRDAYRETNPLIDRQKDRTWSPRFQDHEQDRIDFIYYRSQALQAVQSVTIDTHAELFPSDHAAVRSEFSWQPQATPSEFAGRVVSYNIRHGRGMDERVDLRRTGSVLQELDADFIGLQEVDFNVPRSGGVNQAQELSKQLNMHAAFGKFMNYQGGQYGMAILSRHPLIDVQAIQLPEGNEPRIALSAEARLPTGESMFVVNVHLDWVRDDAFRFAQAERLQEYLEQLTSPYLLLGDFNDLPGSRTLNLFADRMSEAAKLSDAGATFPATAPNLEIDYIFASPAARWSFQDTRVLNEQVTSDHRPLVTRFVLSPIPAGNR
ncbi:MAG TPA: endonuclease/exonuclease/phosphatase family protein [Pirellulaceae bacterium]|nr:endonuclease/exonuclease/phosphatase family protein [Pirellulaceae bacterium]HMO91058.1 endonuclease/exonuclease/phosphatase family protein [Pirellulaceae bacterium]HMP68173.1 endonuclease/exonuclease/phosphatase family protein [Pirellulaceae bacterium]